MKLLIVDDVQEYLNSLSRALKSEYETITAASFEEAKQKMSAEINLALVDVRLSEEDPANRDGILLLGWLHERFPNVPVVMMSAYRDWDAATDAVNLGAVHYLKKPINLQELKEVIRTHAK
ncbi:MAG: response regulator [Candidatus Eisenbacteria bacterium]|nr:response regulator [Candidatus Eisenbacteria bacterium]